MTEIATFAAGCFWGVEAAFRKIRGVLKTEVGYTGGAFENPSYEEVCSGITGHAEAVQIEYDPAQVSYIDLLDYFWRMHDPTSLNSQGPDTGSQYRSAIFYRSKAQQQAARDALEALARSGKYKRKIVTQIAPVGSFFRAEEYHQRYYEKQGWIRP